MPIDTRALTVALVDDYDVVLIGLAHLFDEHRDRVVVAEIDANARLDDPVDVLLYDTFAQPETDHELFDDLVRTQRARHVAVYTWNGSPELIDQAISRGVHGYLSKALPATELVAAIEAIDRGEIVVRGYGVDQVPPTALDWPGRDLGLSERESEVLALITQGRSNAEIAGLTYLSPNTVKSYIRSVYRKIGALSRTQAVLWGVEHGFAPDHHRIDHWLGGP